MTTDSSPVNTGEKTANPWLLVAGQRWNRMTWAPKTIVILIAASAVGIAGLGGAGVFKSDNDQFLERLAYESAWSNTEFVGAERDSAIRIGRGVCRMLDGGTSVDQARNTLSRALGVGEPGGLLQSEVNAYFLAGIPVFCPRHKQAFDAWNGGS